MKNILVNQCTQEEREYWEGSKWKRMNETIQYLNNCCSINPPQIRGQGATLQRNGQGVIPQARCHSLPFTEIGKVPSSTKKVTHSTLHRNGQGAILNQKRHGDTLHKRKKCHIPQRARCHPLPSKEMSKALTSKTGKVPFSTKNRQGATLHKNRLGAIPHNNGQVPTLVIHLFIFAFPFIFSFLITRVVIFAQ